MAKILQPIHNTFECSCICLNVLSDVNVKSISLLLYLTNNWEILQNCWIYVNNSQVPTFCLPCVIWENGVFQLNLTEIWKPLQKAVVDYTQFSYPPGMYQLCATRLTLLLHIITKTPTNLTDLLYTLQWKCSKIVQIRSLVAQ